MCCRETPQQLVALFHFTSSPFTAHSEQWGKRLGRSLTLARSGCQQYCVEPQVLHVTSQCHSWATKQWHKNVCHSSAYQHIVQSAQKEVLDSHLNFACAPAMLFKDSNSYHAIITPLSVQSFGGGHSKAKSFASARFCRAFRIYWLLATPPDTTWQHFKKKKSH